MGQGGQLLAQGPTAPCSWVPLSQNSLELMFPVHGHAPLRAGLLWERQEPPSAPPLH